MAYNVRVAQYGSLPSVLSRKSQILSCIANKVAILRIVVAVVANMAVVEVGLCLIAFVAVWLK
ncbi:Uncharacterised protein [Helicobacter fennelliae]|uniref:Uncharacterized protein n=1 Tax=Helicobacter fennelliae TaxID=215 RepID=A0A2X3E1P5_9HELI|nr:hypothetical protein [Helicobacter fennelliae]SQC36268.1 Uncharacterised protein [Helicobacter fennelliae]